MRLAEELAVLHTSRATPALVEDVPVEAYGQRMPIKSIASLSTPDARTIVVQPWDAHMLKDIQKAIEAAHLGLSSSVDEKSVRLVMPQMSEERRREILKVLGKKVEEARIAVRRIRDSAHKTIDDMEKKKEISEDQKFRSKDALQKIVDENNKKIQDLETQKSRDIQNV